MKKSIWVYGVISGLIIIVINTLSFELGVGYVWLGFLVMFITFSSIFVAMKQYRDQMLGGIIHFKTGFILGLGITVVASIVYVLVWEVYSLLTDYAFIEVYTASLIEKQQAAGLSQAELASTIAEAETIRQQYSNPLFRLPMVFLEIFPVGLLVSLVSAFILKDNQGLTSNN